MKKRILLKDIAEKLNITTNTVSRALNDKPDISEKTKEEVRKVAEEIGYIPDFVASSMRTSYTRTVAVLFDNLSNPYFMIMANSVANHLFDNDYQMMIFTIKDNLMTMDIFKKMISRKVDGVITFLLPESRVAELANNMQLPIFVIGRQAADLNIDSISTDDFNGGQLMGEYLVNSGYKSIAYLGGPVEILCNVERALGLNEYCLNNNVDVNIKYDDGNPNYLENIIDQFVKSNVEAIFCFNDSMAFSTILYIETNYPDKIMEVTGYDNISNHLHLPINITTIGSNIEQTSSICVERLMSKISNFAQPIFTKILDVQLIIKDFNQKK